MNYLIIDHHQKYILTNSPSSKSLVRETSNSETSTECNDIEVDARKLPCPLPLLKLKQALNKAKEQAQITIYATDPASSIDFKAFIATTNHQLSIQKIDSTFKFVVIKQSET